MKKTTDETYGFRVILFDDLNPEDAAMAQALYSRSAESIEKILDRIYGARREAIRATLASHGITKTSIGDPDETIVDALMEISGHNDSSALARRICNDYMVGFNHKSIADCGVTTICTEGISMLVDKAIQDWPLFSGIETSTRYINMGAQPVVDPFGTSESRTIIQRWMSFYNAIQAPVAAEVRRRYPKGTNETDKVYDGAVKARTFDVTRGILPAGVQTQTSCTMNLRQFGDHLLTLVHHPLPEGQAVGRTWQKALTSRYPWSGSFGGGTAGLSGVVGNAEALEAWYAQVAALTTYQPPHPHFDSTLQPLGLRESEIESSRPRGGVLPHCMMDLGQISSSFLLDFGSFRDIQRQRNPPPRMPLLSTANGFEPWYFEQMPSDVAKEARQLVREQTDAINALRVNGKRPPPELLQYLVAMGFRVHVQTTFGLPAFIYVVEQRSSRFVHPTLRHAVLEHMVKPFRVEHPYITLHVDTDPDPWDVRRGAQVIEEKR